MDRDGGVESNAFLNNYFRLIAGYPMAHGSSRIDDRLQDTGGFLHHNAGRISSSSSSSNYNVEPDVRLDVASFSPPCNFIGDAFRQKTFFSGTTNSDIPTPEYYASPDLEPQRRHSIESISTITKSPAASIAHSSIVSSPFPAYVTAAQLCRSMWDDVKHRILRCAVCTKNISMTNCSLILQHARSHCDFESFECLLCQSGATTNTPPYRTNKYQVMYGHMKSAHRGRMIMNETWRRLTPSEIAKIDEQLVSNGSQRSSINDDPDEDRKLRDVIYQCFNEWINADRLWERISANVGDAQASTDRRENDYYYYGNDKASFSTYRGTTTLALPLAPASSESNDGNLQQSPSFQYSHFHQRQPTSIAIPLRRSAPSPEDIAFGQNAMEDERSSMVKNYREAVEYSGNTAGSASKQLSNLTAIPSSGYLKPNRARKRICGGSRSLPALETINQLCQQLRNKGSYYDAYAGQDGSGCVGERRPRIWCHLCNRAIELPEAASRYMTEHVASAHTALKLFCCASCPYEAKTYTQVKAHIKNHHPANATVSMSMIMTTNGDEKYASFKDTFTVKEETMIPLLEACFTPKGGTAGRQRAGGVDGQTGMDCRAAFKSVSTNYEPIKSSKQNGIIGKKSNGIYKCRRCSFTTGTRDELARHRRTTWCAYTWLAIHSCPFCTNFTSRFSSVLRKHIARTHHGISVPNAMT